MSSTQHKYKPALEALHALKQELNRQIIGQSETIDLLLTSLLADGHVLLIGVPGLAKTKLVKTLAALLNWRFSRIQFTPDLMPSDILGMEVLKPGQDGAKELAFVQGPIFTNLLLADEINRTPPRTQSALLEAMQEKQVTVNQVRYELEQPFIVFATENPIEQEGTYPLPEAQLDRFMFSLHLTYPGLEDEITIAGMRDTQVKTLETGENEHLLSPDMFEQLRSDVQKIAMTEDIIKYAVKIVRATRPQHQYREDMRTETQDAFIEKFVQLGAGTRACQHLAQGAQAYAFLNRSEKVTKHHVRSVARYVLAHRIILTYQGRVDCSASKIIDHAISLVDE